MDDARFLPRRGFLLGLGGAAALAAFPRPAFAGAKVLVLGGSTIHGALGKYIEDSLVEAGVTTDRHAKSSSGLARPDFYDWHAAAQKQVARSGPQAVVVMFGGNDGQALFMGDDASPKWIKWDEADAWKAEYRRRVDALADVLGDGGAQIYWMGMPEMKSNKLNGRMERMNTIYAEAMQARASGHFISTRGLMPGATGYAEFAKVGGKQVRVRAEDGVHYSIHGARIVAAAVVPAVAKGLGA